MLLSLLKVKTLSRTPPVFINPKSRERGAFNSYDLALLMHIDCMRIATRSCQNSFIILLLQCDIHSLSIPFLHSPALLCLKIAEDICALMDLGNLVNTRTALSWCIETVYVLVFTLFYSTTLCSFRWGVLSYNIRWECPYTSRSNRDTLTLAHHSEFCLSTATSYHGHISIGRRTIVQYNLVSGMCCPLPLRRVSLSYSKTPNFR